MNGVRFAACTQDVLRHLSAAEAARDGAGPADRMARLAAHLPGQRSAYPLFPARARGAPGRVAGRAPRYGCHAGRACAPLGPEPVREGGAARARAGGGAGGAGALPAKSRRAERPERRTRAFVAVNPGRVAKGNAGGAFALVRIAEHAPAGPGEHAHAVGERARVDIVRV